MSGLQKKLFTIWERKKEKGKGVRNIDAFLIEGGRDSDISHGSNKIPVDTWHVRFISKYQFVVIIRSSKYDTHGSIIPMYKIYGFSKGFEKIKLIAIKNENDSKDESNDSITKQKEIDYYLFTSLKSWTSSLDKKDFVLPNDTPHAGQNQAIEFIIKNYNDALLTNKKRTSALICGDPGAGKSNIGMYIASALGGKAVRGYRLTTLGADFKDLWRLNPTKESPIILILDEIECAFRKAERADPVRESWCMAQDKSLLNSVLDELDSTKYLIVIGTTNLTFPQLYAEGYSSYIRKGRFDHCLSLPLDASTVNDNNFTT